MSTVGSGSMIDEVWRLLTDKQVGIVGLYGAGGVGKTNLLKQIYSKLANSARDFYPVIWVTVSQSFSSTKIQNDIWKKIGVIDMEWVEKSSDEKAEAICDELRGKKFILFLDDMWERMDLERMGIPLPTVENGSKILLTSRSESNCRNQGAQRIMKVETLDEIHAWELFKNKVGEDRISDPRIHDLAPRLAKECGGLPLLLCTVARAMACCRTYYEWELALLQVTKHLSNIPSHASRLLKLCFDSLPNGRVKSCFLFYSLFPEDFTILKNDLIDIWICEQLLDHDHAEKDILQSGYETTDALIGACFLEEEDNNCVKLQDLIRDFGFSTAIDFEILNRGSKLIYAENERSFEGVGWISTMSNAIKSHGNVPQHLLTFLLNHNPFVMIYGNVADIMEHLTVLDLSNTGVVEVPHAISSIKWLQYLNLSHSWIESLPVELKMLTHLECLNLEHNVQLRMIPRQLIYGLSSLKVLKMFRCGYAAEEEKDNILSVENMDIDPVLSLEDLKVLSITITCASALKKFFSNPKLLSCTQSLSLEVFWHSKSLDISLLVAMQNLLALEIHQAEDLAELLMDHGSLHCSGLLKERCFERLREVRVKSCSSLCDLTWVVLAPVLAVLRVESCEQMEEIISIGRLGEILNGGENLEPFAKLEILELKSLPELKSIYWKPLPVQYLKKIEVTECSELKKLPLNSESTNKKDVVIEAEEDWWRNVQWEDNATKTAFQPCFKLALD